MRSGPETRVLLRKLGVSYVTSPTGSRQWREVRMSRPGSSVMIAESSVATVVHSMDGTFCQGGGHAGTEDLGASAQSQTRGKGAYHTGGRVRARRDRTCPRRQTRRAIHEAGDRDRPVEGSACRCQTEAAEERTGLRADSQERCACLPCRSERKSPEAVGEAVARGEASARAGTPARRDPRSALQAGPLGCLAPSSTARIRMIQLGNLGTGNWKLETGNWKECALTAV